MKKNFLLSLVLFFGFLALTGCAAKNTVVNDVNRNEPGNSEIIFYYSTTCPHCQVVEEYINTNKVSDKVGFQSKEVGSDRNNASDLMAKAAQCGIAQDQIGVPFLWDGSKCVVGPDNIIDFFNDKINAK